jgi:thiol:disulfide interchange protein
LQLVPGLEAGRPGDTLPVAVVFVMDECVGCRELEENVFSGEDVAWEAERFVTARANLSAPEIDAERFRDEHGASAAPVVLFVDTAGTVRYDLTVSGGSIRPEDFLRRMREVR